MTGTLEELILATALFVAIHIIPSSMLRQKFVGVIGEKAYLGLYSLASIALLIWMIFAFSSAPYGPVYWETGNWARYLLIIMMVPVSILMIGSYTTPNPTMVMGQKAVKAEKARNGINAITRHPLMWAITLWAALHLLNNGDLKSIIFFVGLGGLSLAGTFLIDAKKAKEMGEDWTEFTAHTSNIPFLAILQGRAKLSILSIWWRALIGIVLFFAFFHLHMMVIGVSPYPL